MIDKILDELKQIKGVKAIYLFGSYATERSTPFSDIDICVITEKNISKDKKVEIRGYSSDKVDISIFWDLPIMMRYSIIIYGKKLFERDGEFLHKIIIETIREYLDFRPVIKRFAESVGVTYG